MLFDERLAHSLISKLIKSNDFRVVELTHTEGSNPGDNYLSKVLRVRVKASNFNPRNRECAKRCVCFHSVTEEDDTEVLNFEFILKCPLDNDLRRVRFRCDEAFAHETCMYTNLIPMLQQLVSQDLPLPEPLYDCKIENLQHLAFEDLSLSGFEVPKHGTTLDVNQCELVVKKLAIFHASSLLWKYTNYVLYKKFLNRLDEHVYSNESANMQSKILEKVLTDALYALGNDVREFPELMRPIMYLMKYKGKMFKTMQTFVKRESMYKWTAICHGDLWSKNMMFKKSGEMDVKFIDLQGVRLSHMMIDLQHFIYSSTTRELRAQHLPRLISLYAKTVSQTVRDNIEGDEKLKRKMKSMFRPGKLMKQFEKCSFYGLVMAMWLLPVLTCELDNIPNLDNVDPAALNENEVTIHNNEYCERLRGVVMDMEKNDSFRYFPEPQE